MTKQEAIANIDKIIDAQFEDFVNATCNEVIEEMNTAAAQGKRRYKGEFTVGYCVSYPPMNRYWKVLLVLDKERIVSHMLAASEKDSISLKAVGKYTRKWDLHAEYSEETATQEMGLVFTRTFFKTKTGVRLCEQVTGKLSFDGLTVKLKPFPYGCHVKYSFTVPSGYKPKPLYPLQYGKTDGVQSECDFSDKIRAAVKTLEAFEEKVEFGGEVSEQEDGAIYSFNVKGADWDRGIHLDCFILIPRSVYTVSLSVGRVSEEVRPGVEQAIQAYNNGKSDDDFTFILTEKTGEFDGMLMLQVMKVYHEGGNFHNELSDLLVEAVKLYGKEDVAAICKVSRPLEYLE